MRPVSDAIAAWNALPAANKMRTDARWGDSTYLLSGHCGPRDQNNILDQKNSAAELLDELSPCVELEERASLYGHSCCWAGCTPAPDRWLRSVVRGRPLGAEGACCDAPAFESDDGSDARSYCVNITQGGRVVIQALVAAHAMPACVAPKAVWDQTVDPRNFLRKAPSAEGVVEPPRRFFEGAPQLSTAAATPPDCIRRFCVGRNEPTSCTRVVIYGHSREAASHSRPPHGRPTASDTATCAECRSTPSSRL